MSGIMEVSGIFGYNLFSFNFRFDLNVVFLLCWINLVKFDMVEKWYLNYFLVW